MRTVANAGVVGVDGREVMSSSRAHTPFTEWEGVP
jgi:hypothetical protein